MLDDEHVQKSRDNLNFAKATKSAFRFLETHGFTELGSEETIIRYANERVFLNIYHGRSSYELGVEFGQVSATVSELPSYSLSALIRLSSSEEADRYRNFVATTCDEVAVGVAALAAAMLKYGGRVLCGDESVFGELLVQRSMMSSVLARRIAYARQSPKAAEAFRKLEYRRAVELYESIRDGLTPAELKKLEYARKHS